jgi:hypothetical protein
MVTRLQKEGRAVPSLKVRNSSESAEMPYMAPSADPARLASYVSSSLPLIASFAARPRQERSLQAGGSTPSIKTGSGDYGCTAPQNVPSAVLLFQNHPAPVAAATSAEHSNLGPRNGVRAIEVNGRPASRITADTAAPLKPSARTRSEASFTIF